MPFVPVRPDDTDLVAATAEILDAARVVDDPHDTRSGPEELALAMRYGWDLEPADHYLYSPTTDGPPVAVLSVSAPQRDNLQLVSGGLTVHPDHRRRGHGSTLLAELLRQAAERGRSIVWLWTRDGDPAGEGFATRHGFHRASGEARRIQVLADVDHDAVELLWQAALERSRDYRLERLPGVPTPDQVLAQLIEVQAAINDAPMGDLSFEPEAFDLQRLKDFETASAGRRRRLYRVIARHTGTGEIGGHTVIAVSEHHPERAYQLDTAVHRDHRGHRLGALLKIDMMRWLAEVEPQVTDVETFNNADNGFMISINEALGYRLTGVFDDWELTLSSSSAVQAG